MYSWNSVIDFFSEHLTTWYGRLAAFGIYIVLITCYLLFTGESSPSWGKLADGVGIISAVFAFLASALNFENSRREQERKRQPVHLTFRNIETKEEVTSPIKIPRGDISRSEALGYVGAIPWKPIEKSASKPRFDVSHVNSKRFFNDLSKIADDKNGQYNNLIIDCTDTEFRSFDFSNFDEEERDTPETAQS